MYTINSGEHFEDWYVSYSETAEFNSFYNAIVFIFDECIRIVEDKNSGSGIEDYLLENHKDEMEEDPEWSKDYSKGFFFSVENENEQIIFLHIDYSPGDMLVYSDFSFEIKESELGPSELAKVQDFILKIKEKLTIY